ncbi:MAG TPA: adenylate/guanylate cyclase domain-containing protein [Acidimicrobiales bacterium]|nr:adenylate/guanylate cyclase domain-containing protein [Acidimicrobiales bacterium]
MLSRTPAPNSYAALTVQTAGRMSLSNLIGSVFVFVYQVYVLPSALQQDDTTRGRYIVVFLAYLLIVLPVIGLAAKHKTTLVQRWAAGTSPPTEEEKIAVLELPWQLTRYSYRAWIGAAAVFTVLNVVEGSPLIDCVRVAVAILFGGLTTCTVSFLLVERLFRPLFARALADGRLPLRRGLQLRGRLMLLWLLGSGIPLLGILLAPGGRPASERDDLILPVVVLAGIGLLSGALITRASSGALLDPLDGVRHALDRVARGDLEVSVAVDDGGELGELEAGFNRMVEGLREKDRLADLFGRHVGVEVARRAIEGGVALGGQLRDVSVLFVDIIGSTTLAENHTPDRVVQLLNEFFSVVVTTVEEGGGWVNKFDGDGALCAWGVLKDDDAHAARALATARSLATALQVLRARHLDLDAGIGVSSGPVVAGNLGARSRFEYTVIGDSVNEASRLTDLAKGEPTRVLAASAAVAAADEAERLRWRPCGPMPLRGRNQPTEAWTVA